MADASGKEPSKMTETSKRHYQALVERVEFQFGEPKNNGSSLDSFIGTVKRVAKNFNSDYVLVRPKLEKK